MVGRIELKKKGINFENTYFAISGRIKKAMAHMPSCEKVCIRDGLLQSTNDHTYRSVEIPFEAGLYEVIKQTKALIVLQRCTGGEFPTLSIEKSLINLYDIFEVNGDKNPAIAYKQIVMRSPPHMTLNYKYMEEMISGGDIWDVEIYTDPNVFVFRQDKKFGVISEIKMG